MRVSAKCGIALAVLVAVSGTAAANDRFNSAFNPANQAIIGMQQLMPGGANRSVGANVLPAVPQALQGQNAIRNVNGVEPSQGAARSLDNTSRFNRTDRNDRLDRNDRTVRIEKKDTADTAVTADAKADAKDATKVAANTTDDTPPAQQLAARASAPPPACR